MKIIDRKFLPVKKPWNAPFISVHAATIEWWKDHFVFAWFGGTREGAGDTCIFVYNLNNNEDFIVMGHKDIIPRWNPILFAHKNNLFLFEKAGMFCDRWQTYIHEISLWNSKITSKEIQENCVVLPAGLNGPVKCRPIIYGNKILCGSSVETFYDWTSYIEEFKHVKNKLEFVCRSNPINLENKIIYQDPFTGVTRQSLGLIQPTLWSDNGVVKALFRSSSGLNRIYYSYMNENGTWSVPVETNLPNPNSGISVAVCNSSLYLAFNNSTKYRTPLMVARLVQKNNSATFEIEKSDDILLVMDGDIEPAGYSYPYMIEQNGLLHLVYTHERTGIEYCVIEP